MPAFFRNPLNLMLLAVPLAAGMKVAGVGGVWMFVGAGLGIIPLARLIGQSTEALAEKTGAGVGGLLNATFGNAAELIIALLILYRGPEFYDVVRATITGSILGNLLLVLGASLLAGGLRHQKQTFNATAAGVGTTLMAIAAAGLLMPTLAYYLPHPGRPGPAEPGRVLNLSEEIAVVLMAVYLLSLLFTLRTHSDLFGGKPHAKKEADAAGEAGHWSARTAVAVMLASTAAVAVLSEWFVGAIEPAAEALGMNDLFVGVIVVAVVGNAAEHFSAVQMAYQNKMDVAVQIAVGSSTQIALFVAPVLVFASLLMGHDTALDLHFTPIEAVAVVLSVYVVSQVAHDGESNWLEGAMLLGLYLILGIAFYNATA